MKKISALLVCILAFCLLLGGCITIESQIPAVVTDANGNVLTKSDANGYVINYYNVNNGTANSGSPDNNMASQPSAQLPSTDTPSAEIPESTPQDTAVVTLSTDEEKLNFFNTAVNKVKAQNAGFKKTKKTVGSDMKLSNSLVNAIASVLKDRLLPNDATETTVNKGESSVAVMSPPGKDFVSALTLADCKSITCEQNADTFIITVTLADETNPDAQNSAYAKIFEFITVDDIMNTYAPDMNATVDRENVFFDFSGCYAKATITTDGTLIGYETFVSGTMRLTNGKIRGFTTDLNIVLSSTTTYTDFQW